MSFINVLTLTAFDVFTVVVWITTSLGPRFIRCEDLDRRSGA